MGHVGDLDWIPGSLPRLSYWCLWEVSWKMGDPCFPHSFIYVLSPSLPFFSSLSLLLTHSSPVFSNKKRKIDNFPRANTSRNPALRDCPSVLSAKVPTYFPPLRFPKCVSEPDTVLCAEWMIPEKPYRMYPLEAYILFVLIILLTWSFYSVLDC